MAADSGIFWHQFKKNNNEVYCLSHDVVTLHVDHDFLTAYC